MKKLVFVTAAALCIIASCTKDDRFDSGQYSSEFAKAGHSFSQVIVIPPNKDGNGDDTYELTEAFASATPGTLIKLLPGEYHVGYIELYGFQGAIEGAGKEYKNGDSSK